MIEIYGDCPKCNMIAKKLKDKNVEFDKINDMELIMKKAEEVSTREMPISFIDGEYKNFIQMIQYVNKI